MCIDPFGIVVGKGVEHVAVAAIEGEGVANCIFQRAAGPPVVVGDVCKMSAEARAHGGIARSDRCIEFGGGPVVGAGLGHRFRADPLVDCSRSPGI